jgi:Flp pilus assembly protein TadB
MLSAMPEAPMDEFDPKRVRAGLIVLSLVVGVALVLAAVIDEPIVRLLMVGIVGFTVVRMFLLTRRVRRDARRSS